jgi:hypothetical protein
MRAPVISRPLGHAISFALVGVAVVGVFLERRASRGDSLEEVLTVGIAITRSTSKAAATASPSRSI